MQAICLAMLAACALSCDKNDDAPAQPLLSEVIYNSYWDIKYQFVYEENGKTEVSGDVQSYHYDELHLVGGEYTKPFIDVIHVGSPSDNSFECYKKAQIKFDDNLVWRQHYQFQQRLPAPIIIDDKARTVTIDTFGPESNPGKYNLRLGHARRGGIRRTDRLRRAHKRIYCLFIRFRLLL